MSFSPIISIAELIDLKEYLLIDASNSKDAFAQYSESHLENSIFVDLNSQLAEIDEDLSKGGRHPLPPLSKFSAVLGKLGITSNSHVIVYDKSYGANAAARFWWMLKSIGHEKVQVLNGGFQEAVKARFPSQSRKTDYKSLQNYPLSQWKLPISDIKTVRKASVDSNFLIIDVRENDRYSGINEPIDLIAGHIPGAINIPFKENLDENGLFLTSDELRRKYNTLFENQKTLNIIVHCGSGVTACHTLLAMSIAGFEIPNLYVGSWSEWSRNN